ncbi:hypothetical protein NHX12_007028 [Muraenolepis orangiensis]|uniref:Ras-related protein Rab-17 n=1 Tax=Muraenolepis orangiensis TaxID=630683 RepID=A0A9Q0IBK3_9TELE|nr:hypothetical protein NHX12_007028 [Muraenolepis orangiensis]
MEPGSTGLVGRGQGRCEARGGGRPLARSLRTLRVKMVLVGSSGVGKSSLALRFSKDEFRSSSPTVGCAYMTQVVHLSDVMLRFEIWDTAGEEKYHSITPLYYRGAHTALVLYDISKRDTFLRAQMWLRELEKQYIQGTTVLVLEGQSLAEDRGLLFMETSSLLGYQVNELLAAIAHRVNSMVVGQQGALTDWQESPLLDLQHNNAFNPFHSCCPKAGP